MNDILHMFTLQSRRKRRGRVNLWMLQYVNKKNAYHSLSFSFFNVLLLKVYVECPDIINNLYRPTLMNIGIIILKVSSDIRII